MKSDESTPEKNGDSEEKTDVEEAENIDKLTKELERIRGNRVLTLLFSYDENLGDSTIGIVYNRLRANFKDTENLDVVLNSSGGDIDAAYGLALILRKYCTQKLTFIIPRWAKSAATLLACSGDEIVMGITSELGPLDPQIYLPDPITGATEVFSPLSIKSTLDILKDLEKDDQDQLCQLITEKINPYTLGEFLRSLDTAKEYQKKLLATRMFKNEKNGEEISTQIAEKMGSGYTHHGYFIGEDEAKNIGLKITKVSDEEWDIIWKIQETFDKSEGTKIKKELPEKESSKQNPVPKKKKD
ncbi:MAG: hypothetical protein B2I17_05980 [Thermoplasmatales archaeon B_DKE]|nr:MAG: hypothetical protein B2I17_05980 [Thermoplasmatales archaeon B_DKE]